LLELAVFQLFEKIVQVELDPYLHNLAVLKSEEEDLAEVFYVITGRGVAPKFTSVGTAEHYPHGYAVAVFHYIANAVVDIRKGFKEIFQKGGLVGDGFARLCTVQKNMDQKTVCKDILQQLQFLLIDDLFEVGSGNRFVA